jgi:hypothetical protein
MIAGITVALGLVALWLIPDKPQQQENRQVRAAMFARTEHRTMQS